MVKLQKPSLEQAVTECNILCFFCHTLQLYMLDNLHILTDKPLSTLFEASISMFNRSKLRLPICVRSGLQIIVDNLVEPDKFVLYFNIKNNEWFNRIVLDVFFALTNSIYFIVTCVIILKQELTKLIFRFA